MQLILSYTVPDSNSVQNQTQPDDSDSFAQRVSRRFSQATSVVQDWATSGQIRSCKLNVEIPDDAALDKSFKEAKEKLEAIQTSLLPKLTSDSMETLQLLTIVIPGDFIVQYSGGLC
eukprot:918876_1